MYKRKSNRKFGRETKQRAALMHSLAHALINKGRITTTQAKAKSLKTYVEKLITKGKNSSPSNIRMLRRHLDEKTVFKLTKEVSQRFNNRNGGYARIINLSPRISDGAKMALIELLN